MSEELSREMQDQVRPLSLESAILDVAPKVGTQPPKSQPAPQTGTRTRPIGRVSLKDPS